jgi:predicted flap endonuclease-1-like 5' DNA nuclease
MSDTKEVILLKTVVDGSVVDGVMQARRYKPGTPPDSKITRLPIKLYNELKSRDPEAFVDRKIVEDKIDDKGEELDFGKAETQNFEKKTENNPKGKELQIIEDDEEENEAEENTQDNTQTDDDGGQGSLEAPNEADANADTDEAIATALTKVKGIGKSLAATLIEKGVRSYGDLAYADRDMLIDLPGIHEGNVADICKQALTLSGE